MCYSSVFYCAYVFQFYARHSFMLVDEGVELKGQIGFHLGFL